VTAAADEITAALLDTPDSPTVSVRIDGDELRVEVRTPESAPEAPPVPDEAEATARISLRLSEALKSDVEKAARADAVSVNTWLVRAASRALTPHRPHAGTAEGEIRMGSAHRITGWING
jgi:hypothetical protein